jgi:hypothetical protein
MKMNLRVDPELMRVLEDYPDFDLNHDTLAAIREVGDKQALEMKAILPKMEEVVQKDRLVPGADGAPDIPVRVYQPKDQSENFPVFYGFMAADTYWEA